MEKSKNLLESCANFTMDELDKLSFTKIVKGKEGEAQFIGLAIMDEEGYLLEYEKLKTIYTGLNYFLRNNDPETIIKMNAHKRFEDQRQKEKDDIIELVSKNIIDKEEEWEEEEEESFFKRLFKRKRI